MRGVDVDARGVPHSCPNAPTSRASTILFEVLALGALLCAMSAHNMVTAIVFGLTGVMLGWRAGLFRAET